MRLHPRLHAWGDHFRGDAAGEIHGVSATGRATVIMLSMNRVLAVAIAMRSTSAIDGPEAQLDER